MKKSNTLGPGIR